MAVLIMSLTLEIPSNARHKILVYSKAVPGWSVKVIHQLKVHIVSLMSQSAVKFLGFIEVFLIFAF